MYQDSEITAGIRPSILKSTLEHVDFEDAVALVGILFEYRIVFSKKFWSLLREHQVTVNLEPLEPQAAALLIGALFGMDCDKLFLAFTRDWHRLKDSPRANELIARIQLHEYVDRLELWSPL